MTRCGVCGSTRDTASCTRCGADFAACPRCSPGRIAGQIEAHDTVCAGAELRARGDLVSKGIEHGVRVGRQRGTGGAALGGTVGALLGLAAGHVATRPELAPALRTVRGLAGVAGQIARAIGSGSKAGK